MLSFMYNFKQKLVKGVERMTESTAAAARVVLLNLRGLDDAVYRPFYESASDERRRRADRYLRHEDAVRCIMAEALLRYAYSETGKSLDLSGLVRTPQGKPYLKNDRNFHFSISHTGNYAAIACAGYEIGMDIEQIDRPLDRRRIAETVFTPEESAYIFSQAICSQAIFSPSEEAVQRLRFAELWTAKESYLKYIGTGFRKSPLSVRIDPVGKRIADADVVLTGFHLQEGCYLTVCAAVGGAEIEYTEVSVLKKVLLEP